MYKLTEEVQNFLKTNKRGSLSRRFFEVSEDSEIKVEAIVVFLNDVVKSFKEVKITFKKDFMGFEIPIGGRMLTSMDHSNCGLKVVSCRNNCMKFDRSIDKKEGDVLIIRREKNSVKFISEQCTGCGQVSTVPVFEGGRTGVCRDCYSYIGEQKKKVGSHILALLNEFSTKVHYRRTNKLTLAEDEANVIEKTTSDNGYPVFLVEHEGIQYTMFKFFNRKSKTSAFTEVVDPLMSSEHLIKEGGVYKSEDGRTWKRVEPGQFRMLRSQWKALRVNKQEIVAKEFDDLFIQINTRGDTTLSHMVKVYNSSRSMGIIMDMESVDSVEEVEAIKGCLSTIESIPMALAESIKSKLASLARFSGKEFIPSLVAIGAGIEQYLTLDDRQKR